jgi:hypothetical protein
MSASRLPVGQGCEEFLRERAYVDFLDYVARLANEGNIDNRYLSWRIKCDLNYIANVIGPKRDDLRLAIKDIVRYVQAGRDSDCPER